MDVTIDEELSCQTEPDNCQDPFAVAVIISLVTVARQQYFCREGAIGSGSLCTFSTILKYDALPL